MKNKATHRGHCQVCNRVQRLPNGTLAKHGYAVLGGYFEGICYGSDHLPLEQDKKMVVESIHRTEVQIKEFKESIVRWSAPATEPEAWFYEYVVSTNRYIPSRYFWRRVPLNRENKQFADGTPYYEDTFISSAGKKESLRRYFIHGDTLLNIADQLNQKYVEQYLQKGIKEMTEYIHDQQRRIEVWHQQPLLNLE